VCLAVPGRILRISAGDAIMPIGEVDFGGIIKEINLACVPAARAGDYVLAHVGFALTVIDEAEAERTLEQLREAAELVET
jgi:hydrogenase expression/formation protein HypC